MNPYHLSTPRFAAALICCIALSAASIGYVGCAVSPQATPPSASPANLPALTAQGNTIGQGLIAQATADGDQAMAYVIPIALDSVVPATGTSNATVAQAIASSIKKSTQNVPSAATAATALANAYAQANPTNQTAALVALAAGVTNALMQPAATARVSSPCHPVPLSPPLSLLVGHETEAPPREGHPWPYLVRIAVPAGLADIPWALSDVRRGLQIRACLESHPGEAVNLTDEDRRCLAKLEVWQFRSSGMKALKV